MAEPPGDSRYPGGSAEDPSLAAEGCVRDSSFPLVGLGTGAPPHANEMGETPTEAATTPGHRQAPSQLAGVREAALRAKADCSSQVEVTDGPRFTRYRSIAELIEQPGQGLFPL